MPFFTAARPHIAVPANDMVSLRQEPQTCCCGEMAPLLCSALVFPLHFLLIYWKQISQLNQSANFNCIFKHQLNINKWEKVITLQNIINLLIKMFFYLVAIFIFCLKIRRRTDNGNQTPNSKFVPHTKFEFN
ncbi:Hypothetical_protein [Hexamita inflata]|uniref:Hypothetical_protein n=1 Tax=Hexamita inflata TaxID=28002 RepID=A0AA86QX87_9EUKA|nr:Hypothetical protein HINF_LOCUS50092 [Hexamita inflata]